MCYEKKPAEHRGVFNIFIWHHQCHIYERVPDWERLAKYWERQINIKAGSSRIVTYFLPLALLWEFDRQKYLSEIYFELIWRKKRIWVGRWRSLISPTWNGSKCKVFNKKRRTNLLLSLFQDWSSVLVTVESDRVLDDQRCAGKQMKSSVLVFESHILFLEYHILLHINLDGDTNVKIQIQLRLEWSKRKLSHRATQ